MPSGGKSYWRRVRKRATEEARAALSIETRERVVIGAVVTITAIALLFFFGSEGASWDEALAKVGPWVILILGVYPVVWVWKFVRAPAQMADEERRRIDALQKALSERARLRINFGPAEPYVRHRAQHRHYRIGICNQGVQIAQNVEVLLTDIRPRPTRPSFRADFPYPLLRTNPHVSYGINPKSEELFEIASTWISSLGEIMVGNLDTKPGGEAFPLVIDPGTSHHLHIRVTSANCNEVQCIFAMKANGGPVSIELVSVHTLP
jgi:hypothetical protein